MDINVVLGRFSWEVTVLGNPIMGGEASRENPLERKIVLGAPNEEEMPHERVHVI
jgi:hypothetical protein